MNLKAVELKKIQKLFLKKKITLQIKIKKKKRKKEKN